MNPALKGKTIFPDLVKSLSQLELSMDIEKRMGEGFIQKFKDVTEPAIYFRSAEMVEKMLTGEYPLTIMVEASRLWDAWRRMPEEDFGVVFPKEGLALLPVPMGIPAKAPHPNAAKLFQDFILSREGAQIIEDGEIQRIFRSDIKVPKGSEWLLPSYKNLTVLPLDFTQISPGDRAAFREKFRKIFGK